MKSSSGAAGLPTLGVVIPTLNEVERLPRLLERLYSGTGADRPEHVVVADGGSTDGTLEAARPRAEVVSASRGRGRQLSLGARRLETDVLVFLHADSLPERGALANVRRAFATPDVGATAMRQRIDGRRRFYRLVERAADARVRVLGLVYGDSGLAVRRGLYDAVGGFRPLPLFEDVDLSLRLRRRTRVRLLGNARLLVSARRWEREGPLRCTARNWMLSLAFLFGSDPERLARRYEPHAPS